MALPVAAAAILYKAIKTGKKISDKYNVPKVIKDQIKNGKMSETVATKMLRNVDELPANVVAKKGSQLKLFNKGGHAMKKPVKRKKGSPPTGERGLTKAQSQAAGLTGDAKRKAAAKLRAAREKEKAARDKEAARKAAQRKKMRNVDRAAALLAGGVMGGGIGNSRLTDKAAQALYDRSVKNAAMRQARKEGRINPDLGFPAVFRKDGSPKEGEIKFEYRDMTPAEQKKFDAASQKNKKRMKEKARKEKFEKYARTPLAEDKPPVNRSAGSPPTGEISKPHKPQKPARPQGVGIAVKGWGKAGR